MRCAKCGSEWNTTDDIQKTLLLCPFCHSKLPVNGFGDKPVNEITEQPKYVESSIKDISNLTPIRNFILTDPSNPKGIKSGSGVRTDGEHPNENYVNISCLGWGPERETYSMESRPDYPVFNSITNNPTIGDERDFVRIGEIKTDTTNLTKEVKVEPGKEYLVYIYYHNNADPSSNSKDKDRVGVAFGVKLLAGYTKKLFPGEKGMVCAKLQSDNSQPGAIWNSATITSDCAVEIKYRIASAKIYNDWKSNGMVLSQNLFTQKGTYLGVNSLDGVILGGGEFHGVVTFILSVKTLEE